MASSAVVFAYHNVGVRCLRVLLAHGVNIRLIVTHTDNPNENIWFDSVAQLAAEHGTQTITPDDPAAPEVFAQIEAAQPDFIFSFYYRHMLKPELLELAKHGAYNMHGSLLPKYRGRVPVNWAIIHGETETGATLHRMVAKPDAGELVAQQAVPILPDDTAHEVFQKVTVAAEMALNEVLPSLLAGNAAHLPQDLTQGGYFGGRKPEDGRIHWHQPALAIHNLIRAVAPPYPGAFCDTEKGELRIFRTQIHAGEGISAPDTAKPALFTAKNALWASCGDGQLLKVLHASLNNQPLHTSSFTLTNGGRPLLMI